MLMASDNSLLQWLPTDPKADPVALDQIATLAGLNLSYTHEPLKEPSQKFRVNGSGQQKVFKAPY